MADRAAARDLLADELGADWVCVRPQAGPGQNVEPSGDAAEVVDVPTTELVNGEAARFESGVLCGDTDGGCVWVEQGDERTTVV